MSNADDRCAREGCGKERREHQHGGSAAGCRFVESREDALARRARYQVSVRLATLRASAAQPAPSGDEAKVREIAEAVAAGYAAGKADGAREVDRLKDLINRDKTGLALGLNKIQRIAKGFDWICEGRGPYEYDDDRYRMEVGSLVAQVLAVAKEHLNASGELADEAFHPRAKETVRALADAIARRGSEGI